MNQFRRRLFPSCAFRSRIFAEFFASFEKFADFAANFSRSFEKLADFADFADSGTRRFWGFRRGRFLKEKDVVIFGKVLHLQGALYTCLVALFCVIVFFFVFNALSS